MTKRLAGHYQLNDSRLTENEQQELESQLREAAKELDIPFEIFGEYYRQSLSDESIDISSEIPITPDEDEFCLGVHLPSWHAGYRKCLEIMQEQLNG